MAPTFTLGKKPRWARIWVICHKALNCWKARWQKTLPDLAMWTWCKLKLPHVWGVHELIMSFPKGYNSPVGRDGAMLSGGQRQRVGLARALYGRPVFVVLDEPNSSLDEAGDAALAKAILALKQLGTTFVIMTHRSSILGVADKMLLMREGAQQAFGPRDEVLAALQKAQA
jgi:ABC-type protease/lipase transport system fused ATPase/permease subunit